MSTSPLPPTDCSHPDFLVIGAMKAGTTTLYHDLRSQPGVFLPDKEGNALLADDPAEEFAAIFGKAAPGALTGEVCPDYTKPNLDERAAAVARELFAGHPPPKLIYLVRHPIDRLLSHHYFVSTQHGDANPGGMTSDLEASLRDFPELIETSRYAARLKPWIDAFGREAVIMIRFEDYVADRGTTIEEIVQFLGLVQFSEEVIQRDRVFNPSHSRPVATPFWRRIMRNPAYRKLLRPLLPLSIRDRVRSALLPKPPPRPHPPSEETRQHLVEIFRPDVEALREYVGGSEPLWDLEGSP